MSMSASEVTRAAQRQQGSVFWAWLHGEDVRASYMSSVIAMLLGEDAGLIGSLFDLPTGPNLSVARNAAAEAFLASTQEWLWFTDSDTVFAPTTLRSILAVATPDKRPIVAAAVPVTAHDPVHRPIGVYPELSWAAYQQISSTDSATGITTSKLSPWPVSSPLGAIQEVAAAGTGCMVIHRSAIEATSPGPFSEIDQDGVAFGEDLSFCLRARDKGIPTHVAGTVRVGHAKVVTL